MSYRQWGRCWQLLWLPSLLLSASCELFDGGDSEIEAGAGAEASADSAVVVEAVPVEIARVTGGSISSYLLFSSTIETEAAVEIYAEVSGLVEAVEVEEGDHVGAGRLLVRLVDDQARIEDEESLVNLRHLEVGFRRTDEMYRRELISAQQYEDKQFELDQARLRRDKARLALEHTRIRAPLPGVITRRSVQAGSRIDTGTELFELLKLDDLIARLHVPVKYLSDIEVGQAAEISTDLIEGLRCTGTVARISPVIDPQSGTFKVTVGIEGPRDQVRPGLFVNVRIVTDTHEDAVLVPKEAIVYDGGNRYVFTVVDSTATRVRLNAGFENDKSVEALSLIAPETPIIVVGQNGLRDQARVRVVNSRTAEATPGSGQS